MRCLVLDVDAVAHARGLKLLPPLEALIAVLPERACVERSVYTEMIRQGLGRTLEDWQRQGLLQDPVDYRRLPEGDATYRALPAKRWPQLSRQDRASLALARLLGPSGLLTCEVALAEASCIHRRVRAV